MDKIGEVNINYDYYHKKDMLDHECFDQIISEINLKKTIDSIMFKDYKHMYYLSPLRSNVINWIPKENTKNVLEIGSSCGAITKTLADKFQSVTCIEQSKKRSVINATINKEKTNINIFVGDFYKIEPNLKKFDIIFLIGLPYYFIDGQKNQVNNILGLLRNHLVDDGIIYLAVDNKFGLKYWAGTTCNENKMIFSSIQNDTDMLSMNELKNIVKNQQYVIEDWYYPYPDYVFSSSIYSDSYLPKLGELNNNDNNYEYDRIVTFNESSVYDALIEDGRFQEFSNSYLLVLRKEIKV